MNYGSHIQSTPAGKRGKRVFMNKWDPVKAPGTTAPRNALRGCEGHTSELSHRGPQTLDISFPIPAPHSVIAGGSWVIPITPLPCPWLSYLVKQAGHLPETRPSPLAETCKFWTSEATGDTQLSITGVGALGVNRGNQGGTLTVAVPTCKHVVHGTVCPQAVYPAPQRGRGEGTESTRGAAEGLYNTLQSLQNSFPEVTGSHGRDSREREWHGQICDYMGHSGCLLEKSLQPERKIGDRRRG